MGVVYMTICQPLVEKGLQQVQASASVFLFADSIRSIWTQHKPTTNAIALSIPTVAFPLNTVVTAYLRQALRFPWLFTRPRPDDSQQCP